MHSVCVVCLHVCGGQVQLMMVLFVFGCISATALTHLYAHIFSRAMSGSNVFGDYLSSIHRCVFNFICVRPCVCLCMCTNSWVQFYDNLNLSMKFFLLFEAMRRHWSRRLTLF